MSLKALRTPVYLGTRLRLRCLPSWPAEGKGTLEASFDDVEGVEDARDVVG